MIATTKKHKNDPRIATTIQQWQDGRERKIVSSFDREKDFKRLSVTESSKFYTTFTVAELKGGRLYERFIEIDKTHLAFLIGHLQELYEKMVQDEEK